jgi:hypothetical protein
MVNPLKRRVLEETALCMVKPAFTHVKREEKKMRYRIHKDKTYVVSVCIRSLQGNSVRSRCIFVHNTLNRIGVCKIHGTQAKKFSR